VLREATGTLWRLVIGRPLANREQAAHKIGPAVGLSTMGLDGLASSSYGPEAVLAALMPLGAAGLVWLRPIMLAIIALLLVLYVSYRQTIRAYPVNGGSYAVARDNLGTNAGLLAAISLMIDYLLNVAVAISAGVAALVSAIPALHPYTLWLCLAVLLFLTLANLRGTLEAGLLFVVPTFLFLGCFGLVLGAGLVKTFLAHGHPAPVVAPPPLATAAAPVGLWLLAHAFASGCTAMTGVEAVSNGVGAFREPPVPRAHRTLTAIVGLLVLLLLGVTLLAQSYGVGAMEQTRPGYQTVLSQLAGAVVGRGGLYYLSIAALLTLLVLSANTSFVGFPRLCRIVAQDDFLPRGFTMVGRRLVYSVGIVFLALFGSLLIIAFGGVTDRLIPLFAVGAFAAFTLSQAGMTVHWYRRARAGEGARSANLGRLAINGFGAAATGGALVVILAAKFTAGAWLTVLVIPVLFLVMKRIKRYYEWEERQIHPAGVLRLGSAEPPVVVIPTERWNLLADKAIEFAFRLSPDVVAIHVTALSGPEMDEHEENLRRQWSEDVERPARAAGLKPPQLVLVSSPFRRFVEPHVAFVHEMLRRHPGRTVAVLLPEIVKAHWWENLLHGHRARRLRNALVHHGDPRLVIIDMPWYLEPPAESSGSEPVL
jgi:amino acid transporter